MKIKSLFTIIMVFFMLGIILCFSSFTIAYLQETQDQTNVSDVNDENLSTTRSPARLTRDRKVIDIESFYQSRLKEYADINDFSSESLISLLDNEKSTIRQIAAMYLDYKKERLAIPKLEEALDDKSFFVMLASAKALSRMDNRKGVEKLKEFCEKVYKEVGNGNLYSGMRHPNNELLLNEAQALRALADAGEVSAIPYIRTLLENNGISSIRLHGIRALIKLYEKDKSVLKDIKAMIDDSNPRAAKEASDFLEKLEKNK